MLTWVKRRAETVCRPLAGHGPHDVRDCRSEAWIARREGAALDDDHLGERTRSGEPALAEHLVGTLRLADAATRLVDRLLTDARAGDERADHEDQPARDREATVTGTPPPHPGGKVAGLSGI